VLNCYGSDSALLFLRFVYQFTHCLCQSRSFDCVAHCHQITANFCELESAIMDLTRCRSTLSPHYLMADPEGMRPPHMHLQSGLRVFHVHLRVASLGSASCRQPGGREFQRLVSKMLQLNISLFLRHKLHLSENIMFFSFIGVNSFFRPIDISGQQECW
jgi:hypothetical protein